MKGKVNEIHFRADREGVDLTFDVLPFLVQIRRVDKGVPDSVTDREVL